MAYLRPWSAKQGLKINPLRHSMISFFFLIQRLFGFVGFVLVCRDFFLHHTATVLVLSILLLTREKENSSLSGPQVDLCWPWLSLQPPFSQNWGRICNSAFFLRCIFFPSVLPSSSNWEGMDFPLGHGFLWSLPSAVLLLALLVTLLFSNSFVAAHSCFLSGSFHPENLETS